MAKQRKVRTVRTEIVPEFVRTADHREASLLASSPNTLKAHEARRGQPLIVPQTVKRFGMFTLNADEIMELRVDTRYQREEVTNEVNALIVVLKKGGMIPDPISVAERKYGDRKRYIVDGQQRWWAHVDTSTPLAAVIYHVSSYDDEVALFHALNSQVRVSPETRLRSLPGPAGDTLRRLSGDTTSPLFGKISFADRGPMKFGAMVILRGMTALIANIKPVGGLDRVSPSFDRVYKQNPRLADRMIDQYAWLLSQVFEDDRVRSVAAVALGRMLYAAYANHGGEMPTVQALRKLKSLKWERFCPTPGLQWLPTVVAAAQEIWPVQMVQETKHEG
jgi:hypothetical protein